ncbi:MAG: PorV/PorQ family protein [candidate division Zixibacteria bacterium]|nr:PorV/PorQ family protein [candidate division Zixibacteria bacterium]
MKRILVLSCILMTLLITAVQTYAQVSLSTVLFLRIAAGARAAGMGESFVAVADDATATHWNPAGLGFYPLASMWVDCAGEKNHKFESLALMKNDRPESNYKSYDLWAISGSELYTWDGEEWQDHLSLALSSGESVESVLRKYTQEENEERLKMMLEKTISEKGKVKLPYSTVFMDSLNCIFSDEKNLWIGANNGLYKFDGTVWKRFTLKDGLPTEKILSLDITPLGTMWIGTDSGLVKFDGKVFSRTYFASEVKDYYITEIKAKSDKEIWAATPTVLMKLERDVLVPYIMLKVKSFEELREEMVRFSNQEDSARLEMIYKRIEEFNYMTREQFSEYLPLKIEYNLALDGKITCLAIDRKGDLLVGTETGLLKYEEGKWNRYGYKKYEVKGEKTAEEVAAKFLPYADKDRIDAMALKIVEYNRLQSRELHPGQKLYVYANSLGSRILSIAMIGENTLFVGTEFGIVRYDGENWGKYYHGGLERIKTHTIINKDKDIFFGTDTKAVIYANAKRELTFMHATLLPELADDIYYEYLSYVQNTENWGTLGGNITFISYGSIPHTGEEGPTILGELNPYEAAITLSYGTRMGKDLALGLGAKFIYSHLSDQGAGQERGSGSGSSFAVDAGLIYKTPFKKLTLGAAVTNLGPDISYIDVDQADPLPRNLALGFAYKLFNTPYNKLTLVGEMNKELVDVSGGLGKFTEQAVKNVGVEYWYANYVALRAGYIYDKVGEIKTATFGAGLRISLLNIDFAYVPANKEVALANTTRISGTVRF